jgi:ribonuclease HI
VVHDSLFEALAGLVTGSDPSVATTEPITIYTDGACSGNPGPGGWAWATAPDGEPHSSGGERHSTNQRMEVRAVLEALRAHPDSAVHIVSDSTYVVHCFRDRWYDGWMKRGWKNSQKQPVANRDLWEPLIDWYLDRKSLITFAWVKGHSGHPMNDLVDRLAVAAAAGPFDEPVRPVTASPSAAGQASLF